MDLLLFIDYIICLRKKGGFSLTQNQTPVTTTEQKIGKVTYLVCSSASERATDTLDKKIKKLIRKDMELNPANARK
ncbi:transposon-encoded TnpW family protein [Enterocloster aldenensis]|uniref:transposon-encoded TnpW family protein n=1 Tax=Clostridia TaxID=186801 RepID=UPI001D08072E|nr:transposon-encoded TnpW family protein [Enterocloster aldenensis]